MNEPEGKEKILDEALGKKKGIPKPALLLAAAVAAVLLVAAAVSVLLFGLKKPVPVPEDGTTAAVQTAPGTQLPSATQAPTAAPPQSAGLEQALALYGEDRYDLAIQVLDAVLLDDPDSGYAYMYRGMCQFQLDAYDKAIMDLTQAFRRWPGKDAPLILTYRGAAYVLSQLYPEGVGDLTRAIELDPVNENAYLYRAKAYEATGKPDLAAADRARAAEAQR